MRALVIGGNGFIGSHLVDRLLRAGHAVRVFDRQPESHRSPLAGVEYATGDFGNRQLVAEALDGIDVAFHLASTTLPKTSNDDPAFDVRTNVVDTLGVLDACVARGVGRVVYASSGGTVYGPPAALPVDEDAPAAPMCSYGIAKLSVEKYLELYRRLRGLDYVAVRPSNPYGPRQNPGGIQGAVGVFLGVIARRRPIEVWGDGSIVRDYLYVADLADGIYRAAVAERPPHRVYNLGSGAGVSVRELIGEIEAVVGRAVDVKYQPARAFDVPAIYLDVARAGQDLGWRPTTPLREGLKETWEFIRSLSRRPRPALPPARPVEVDVRRDAIDAVTRPRTPRSPRPFPSVPRSEPGEGRSTRRDSPPSAAR